MLGQIILQPRCFFDNEKYFHFRDKIEKAGINLPLVPGIKTVTTSRHLEILPQYFNCSFPQELVDGIIKYKGKKEDIRKFGIEYCIGQCEDLKKNGVPSLHFYAARKAPIKEVIVGLKGR